MVVEAMTLSFSKGPGVSLGGAWMNWAAEHEPPALFLSAWSGPTVHGFDSRLRVGGVLAQPADVVLGIRAWEDAFEETHDLDGCDQPVPSVLFEIEKLVRMMLHQSGLAFEILASPAVHCDMGFPARRIVESAITTDILHHYRDVASGAMRRFVEVDGQGVMPTDVLDAVRNALTGRALAEGRVAFDVWELADEYGSEALLREVGAGEAVEPEMLDDVAKLVESLLDDIRPGESGLPASPKDYDWLNDFVVSCRRAV
jgi:predicted nucleotidyltransferase